MGQCAKPHAFGKAAQRHRDGNRHLLIERHARILAASHPGDLNPSTIVRRNVAKRLGGVAIRALNGLAASAFPS